MAARPGVMLYFDLRTALQHLTMEERGELFTAILGYAETGVLPELDGMVGLCFDLVRPKIEHDAVRYEEVKTQRRYAVYCREVRRNGGEPVSFDTWLSGVDQPMTSDSESYPSTSTSTSASVTASKADKPPCFSPPSLQEVKEYCQQRHSTVDPERFYEYFETGDWKDAKKVGNKS